jgi:serine protease Do
MLPQSQDLYDQAELFELDKAVVGPQRTHGSAMSLFINPCSPSMLRKFLLRALTLLPVLYIYAALGALPGPGAEARRDATVRAVEMVLPSVVNISTETVIEARDPLDELFREFFGHRRRPPGSQKSLGSGVIIDEEGYVLTNWHVIRRANRINVTLADGREFEAHALSRTAKSDIALLKLVTKNNEKFQAISIAGEDDLLLAESVLALGNPFGLGVSVSRGILSSKTRRPPVADEPLEVEDWLQTDAAINPGNSGGPLINLSGELIGLNVAVFREGQGIGFAIPVKRLLEAISEIFTPEEVKSLWFGARLRALGNEVVVASVEPTSPADKAGLKERDVIRLINGKKPVSLIDLNREIVSAGEKGFGLVVNRGNERHDLSVRPVSEQEVFNAELIEQKLGIVVRELTPAFAARLRLAPSDGLAIAGVEKNSPAANARLNPGYVLRGIDGRATATVRDAARMLYGRQPGQKVVLQVMATRARGGLMEVFPATAEVTVR